MKTTNDTVFSASLAASFPAATRDPSGDAVLVALAASLGYAFDTYAVNIFGMLKPLIRQDLGLSVATVGTIGSIFLAGYTLGTVVFGYLADKVGRRNTLRFAILLYGTSTCRGVTAPAEEQG